MNDLMSNIAQNSRSEPSSALFISRLEIIICKGICGSWNVGNIRPITLFAEDHQPLSRDRENWVARLIPYQPVPIESQDISVL